MGFFKYHILESDFWRSWCECCTLQISSWWYQVIKWRTWQDSIERGSHLNISESAGLFSLTHPHSQCWLVFVSNPVNLFNLAIFNRILQLFWLSTEAVNYLFNTSLPTVTFKSPHSQHSRTVGNLRAAV